MMQSRQETKHRETVLVSKIGKEEVIEQLLRLLSTSQVKETVAVKKPAQ
jgi:hypothetical protein